MKKSGERRKRRRLVAQSLEELAHLIWQYKKWQRMSLVLLSLLSLVLFITPIIDKEKRLYVFIAIIVICLSVELWLAGKLRCPNCNARIVSGKMKYCPWCGNTNVTLQSCLNCDTLFMGRGVKYKVRFCRVCGMRVHLKGF